MSIKLMSAVWEMDLPVTEKFVLLALADNANDNGTCWPSVPKIAVKTSLSVRAVQNAFSSLETRQLLRITRRHGHSNVYHLTPAPPAPPPAGAAPPPPHLLHHTPAGAAPRTIIESSFEPKKNLTDDLNKSVDKIVDKSKRDKLSAFTKNFGRMK